jgi:hypothetical protein
MTTAFILGNGVSRRGINLTGLKSYGRIYGCNALYREFTPDVLIATDSPIATQIQESGYSQQNEFYTRKPIEGLGAKPLVGKYQGYSSGPNAVGLAAYHGHSKIYLLGFDMGPDTNNLFNNVYADTEFYKTSAHPPTFTGNWIKQIIQICQDYPEIEFIRIYGDTTAKISELDKIKNLKHQPLVDFITNLTG